MTKNGLIVKRTYGVPNLEYKTSYLKGFEVINDKFLLLTLSHCKDKNFELKIPLGHLDIKENRFISTLNINDDDNRYLVDIIDSIYGYNDAILDDIVGEEAIMYNVDITALCDYINSMSMLNILLYFDCDGELVYIDLFKINFKHDARNSDKRFKGIPAYQVGFSLPVSDVGKLYKQVFMNI